MTDASALETELQPSFHVGVLLRMLAFGVVEAGEPDTVVDTCSRKSAANKEEDMRLAGFELLVANVGHETVGAASTTELRGRVDFGDPRDVLARASDCNYGRQCAAIHEIDPDEAVADKVLRFLSGPVDAESEWGRVLRELLTQPSDLVQIGKYGLPHDMACLGR